MSTVVWDGACERMLARDHAGVVLEHRQITNTIDTSLSESEQIDQLLMQAAQLKPSLEQLLSELDSKLATRSIASVKGRSTSLEKIRRPTIVNRRPWYSPAHISDMLRSQTSVSDLKLLAPIIKELLASDAEVICIDATRLLNPAPFGFRFVSITLKVAAILVDFQVLVDEVDVANAQGHDLYDRWRSLEPSLLSAEQAIERMQAQTESFSLYTQAWLVYLERTQQSETDVNRFLNEMWAVVDSFAKTPKE